MIQLIKNPKIQMVRVMSDRDVSALIIEKIKDLVADKIKKDKEAKKWRYRTFGENPIQRLRRVVRAVLKNG